MSADATPTTALIIPLELPVPLETVRRVHTPSGAAGVPAHVTLLYPFVDPIDFDSALEERLAALLAAQRAFDFQLATVGDWPGTIYLRPEPREPLMRLYEILAAAFPEWPIYAGRFPMEPHVTLAEFLDAATQPTVLAELGRAAGPWLPVDCQATSVDLIEQGAGGRWSQRWSFALLRP